MHILFLSDNFPPEVNAPASRTFEHCREWVKSGHQVTLITCAPNFPKGKVFEGYKNRIWQTENVDGIRVIRVWSYIAANDGFTKRILDYVSFMVTAIIASIFVRKVDVIVGTSPQFFTACAAYVVSIFKRRPWIFELRDIWPASIRAVGAMKQSKALDFLEKVELFLYRKSNAIISVTNTFRDELMQRGIDGSKIFIVTNGVDAGRFSPSKKDQKLLGRLGLHDKFIAGYIGTHGMAHALDTLLDAAELLAVDPDGDDYRVLFLGDGAEKNALKTRAEKQNLSNVIFVDSVSKDEVVAYWSILDVSIIHLKKSELFTKVIPSKLFECMGMGVPVLHGVEGESAEIVKKQDVGITFEPENASELVSALKKLKSDSRLFEHYKKQGPIAAKNYDRAKLANDMLTILEQVNATSNSPASQ